MDVSNTTGENTDYRVTVTPSGTGSFSSLRSRRLPGARSPFRGHTGKLRAKNLRRNVPLPPGSAWIVEFRSGGNVIASTTVHDPGCHVVLVKTESGSFKILITIESEAVQKIRAAKNMDREYNEERLELLAQKYSGESFSADDEARLEALTQKVRHLLPRVAEKDWKLLEEVSLRLEGVEERTRSIRKKYGLNS